MADIVDELRDRAYCGKSVDLLLDRAAKTIEDLRQQIKEERAKATYARPPVVALPGQHFANAAFAAGEEDRYSNEMARRYGGDDW